MEKIPLEEWKKLTKEEQDWHTLEFAKYVEKRRKWTIIATRTIAVFFIFGLFYMGYVQLQSIKNYNKKIDTYGVQGFCALCGEYSLKKCECQYAKTYDFGNKYLGEPNLTKIGEELAEYNVQSCKPFNVYKEEKIKEILNNSTILLIK